MNKTVKKSRFSQKTEKRILIFTFTIIPVFLLLMLSYYPLVKMFQYSLTEWNGYSPDSKFVGLDNYKTVLTNPKYFTVFKTSLYYFFATFCNWVSLYCLQRFCPLRSNLLIFGEGILFSLIY